MKKLLKTTITLAAIGVAVKVIENRFKQIEKSKADKSDLNGLATDNFLNSKMNLLDQDIKKLEKHFEENRLDKNRELSILRKKIKESNL